MGIADSASEAEVRALIDRQGLTFPNIYDPEKGLRTQYAAGIPTYVFLDKAGRIAYKMPGAPRDVNIIKAVLVALQQE